VERGQHTYQEIMSQPHVWQSALSQYLVSRNEYGGLITHGEYYGIIVTGCGSTHYLSLTAAKLLRHCNRDVVAHPASELLLYPDSVYLYDRKYILIAVSRSGTTSETVRAVEQFREQERGQVVTVTCDSTSPLAELADIVFAVDDAQEESVAQTRSFSSMAVVLQQMVGLCHTMIEGTSGDRLPDVVKSLLDTHHDLAKSLGENKNIKKFFFLGSDALYGIACEAMLKMKEMSLSYSEAFHMMEFRHGPMSMVSEDSLVVGMISPQSAKHDIQVLKEMQDMGATILAIGQDDTDFEHHIALPDDLPAWNTPILYLPVLQLLGYYRSLFNGQNPDSPQNLTAVISLDDI